MTASEWSSTSNGGAFVAAVLHQGGFGTTWQQPHGRIFWAGTEESTRWPGYFEGAIEAGIQAVDRAAASLDGDNG